MPHWSRKLTAAGDADGNLYVQTSSQANPRSYWWDAASALAHACAVARAGWSGSGVSGERARALLGGYRAVRPLQPIEFELLPAYLRRALLRYLCFRLERFGVGGGAAPAVAGHAKSWSELATKLRALRAGHA